MMVTQYVLVGLGTDSMAHRKTDAGYGRDNKLADIIWFRIMAKKQTTWQEEMAERLSIQESNQDPMITQNSKSITYYHH